MVLEGEEENHMEIWELQHHELQSLTFQKEVDEKKRKEH